MASVMMKQNYKNGSIFCLSVSIATNKRMLSNWFSLRYKPTANAGVRSYEYLNQINNLRAFDSDGRLFILGYRSYQ